MHGKHGILEEETNNQKIPVKKLEPKKVTENRGFV